MKTSMLIAVVLLTVAGQTSAASRDEDEAANATARTAAAQKVYKGLLARWAVDPNVGPGVYEQLHRWSRRWMQSQAESGTTKDQFASAEAHLARMRALEKTARKLEKEKFLAAYEVSAVEFYRLEAERHLRSIQKK